MTSELTVIKLDSVILNPRIKDKGRQAPFAKKLMQSTSVIIPYSTGEAALQVQSGSKPEQVPNRFSRGYKTFKIFTAKNPKKFQNSEFRK